MPSLRPGLDLKVILWEMSFQFFYFEFISHYEIGYCTLGCHYNTSHPSKFKWIGEKWFLNYWLDNEGSLLLLQGFRLRNFQIDDNFWGSEKFCMWFLEKIESFFFWTCWFTRYNVKQTRFYGDISRFFGKVTGLNFIIFIFYIPQ